MIFKLFGVYQVGIEVLVLMFEQEIYYQNYLLGELIWKEYVGCFGMMKVEGKQEDVLLIQVKCGE